MNDTITINFDSKNIKNALNKKNGEKSKRTNTMKWDIETKKYLFSEENHINILDDLYNNRDFTGKDNLLGELKKKMDSYKNQDIKKNRYQCTSFITMDELIFKLKNSQLKCHYCLKDVKLIYENVRDPKQWTLDRIDNNKCHTNENTVVADLCCNLQRRVKDEKKFKCDKQLVITMVE